MIGRKIDEHIFMADKFTEAILTTYFSVKILDVTKNTGVIFVFI
jgi:hypothetical protein